MRERKKETGGAFDGTSRFGENEVKRGFRYFFFLAAGFLAAGFLAGAFLAAGFLAASFFAGAFFAAGFLAGAFLAGAFLVAIDNPPFPSAVAHRKKF
jgi:hypothetical protein